jgi:hypothetical protein
VRISQSLESIVRAALITVAAALIFVLIPEARKIPAKVAADLRRTLTSDPKALAAWEEITPLARVMCG